MSARGRALREELGWVITPDEIKGRMQALDALIVALAGDIERSTSPLVNQSFRDAFEAFRVRWFAFKGGTDAPMGRWFATPWEPRYQDFLASYERWLRLFQQRRDPKQPSQAVPPSEKMRDLSDEFVEKMGPHVNALTVGMLGAAALLTVVLVVKR